MRAIHEEGRIQTTLGDLVAALSDAAFEVDGDEKEAYILASLALHEIFRGDRGLVRSIKES